jgi:hypothetical protein
LLWGANCQELLHLAPAPLDDDEKAHRHYTEGASIREQWNQTEQEGLFRTVPTTEGTGTFGSTVELDQSVGQVQEEEIDFDTALLSGLG